MRRNHLDIIAYKDLANKLPEQMIINILNSNKSKTEDQIVDVLLEENEKYKPYSEQTKFQMAKDDYFTLKCENFYCDQNNCFYYHNDKQYRRPQSHFFYKPSPCFNVFRNDYWEHPSICRKKESCKFSHTKNEITYYIGQETRGFDNFYNEKNTLQSEEFVSLSENFCNNEIEYFISSISGLNKEINEKSEECNKKMQKLQDLNRLIKDYESRNFCVLCWRNHYTCIALPCGHPLCSKCRSLPNCPKCNYKCDQIVNIKHE